ncbi:MAG TPA: hypothetical protein H9751_03290 [Candidatus Corynebacterium faecigallinarum]|uniref:Uncharacterized protein n=1 Tax=Candidatus Corynebacterium faecigallinarum TaxID=2838528 RepID=A0A9D2TPQ7_9CORY|nr:hypothetical protein [Candidatus Corynebacterium faecigallinarum]
MRELVYYVAVASFAMGAGSAFFYPAYSSYLPEVLPPEQLLAAIGLADNLIVMLVALFIVGATTGAGVVIWGTLLQRLVPLDMIGRVASLDFFVSIAFMPVSIALAGPLSLLVPVPVIFVVAGVLPPLVAVVALAAGRMRQAEAGHPLDAS